jgi:hypothetical protein
VSALLWALRRPESLERNAKFPGNPPVCSDIVGGGGEAQIGDDRPRCSYQVRRANMAARVVKACPSVTHSPAC